MLVKLEDVCEILDNKRVPITAQFRKSGIYPYYGANGLQDYIDDYIFDDELVLLAEDGGNFGSKDKPIAYRVSGKCWVNNHAHVLKPLEDKINVDYLCYSLMFYDVSNIVNGSTRKKLNQAEMRNMLIPLKSMEEQHRIVAILDQVNDLISLRNQQLEQLDLLIKSRFVEMFGDPVKNEKGWILSFLNDICESIVDCPHSTPNYTDENTGFMCIRTTFIKKNQILWDKLEYISEEEFYYRTQRRKPSKGDIIYTREGAVLGIAAIINKDCNIALGQRCMLLSPNKAKCRSEFLCRAMNFETFLDKALKNKIGSASPHINVADIKSFPLILPPLELQTQFSEFVQQVDKSKLAIMKSLEQLETLNKKLMQDYFG